MNSAVARGRSRRAVLRQAAAIQIDLDVDVGGAGVDTAGPRAQQLGNKAAQHDE